MGFGRAGCGVSLGGGLAGVGVADSTGEAVVVEVAVPVPIGVDVEVVGGAEESWTALGSDVAVEVAAACSRPIVGSRSIASPAATAAPVPANAQARHAGRRSTN